MENRTKYAPGNGSSSRLSRIGRYAAGAAVMMASTLPQSCITLDVDIYNQTAGAGTTNVTLDPSSALETLAQDE